MGLLNWSSTIRAAARATRSLFPPTAKPPEKWWDRTTRRQGGTCWESWTEESLILGGIVNQGLIDEIVANVLARLQNVPARPVSQASPAAPAKSVEAAAPNAIPASNGQSDSKPSLIELFSPVITADMLENSVRPGQGLRIGRMSILTPSARDWLHSKRTVWTRHDKSGGSTTPSGTGRNRWQIILQTVTPTVRALHDGLRRLSEGWKIELVGQPSEAAAMAIHLVSTAESDGVVVFTEQAELIACKANRNERVRAAVIQSSRQWEQVVRTLGANVVCISPIGQTFMELRNLLRDCAGTKPKPPAGW